MNLTITPLYSSYKQQTPSFKANPVQSAEEAARQIATQESGLFAPLYKKYDKLTDKIAKHFTSKFVESKPMMYLADKFKNSKNLFQHTLTVGSVITSGLYMQRTYTNKDLDKDRRNTLVVNQGLTLAVSTAGAYLLDRYLKGWWDNVTARFAGHLLGDKDFLESYKQNKDALKAKEKGLNDFIKEQKLYKVLTKDQKEILMKKVKGMGPLRTMIVFGFVYRYFVPVAVTKPANKLCEIYLEKKKAKQQQA